MDDDGISPARPPAYPTEGFLPSIGGADYGLQSSTNLVAPTINHPLSGAGVWTQLSIDLGDGDITVSISPADKPLVKQRLRALVRKEKRRAANAANAANTAQQIGVGIGGALAVTGGVALITVAAPLVLAAALATGAGAIIAIAGLSASHVMNSKKYEREEKIGRFTDALEDLK